MSPSPPPQGRSAAGLSGSVLLRPFLRPPRLASRSFSSVPHFAVSQHLTFFIWNALPHVPQPPAVSPSSFSSRLGRNAAASSRKPLLTPRLGQAPPLGSPSQPCPLKSGHSVGTGLCPRHWTVSPERAGPGLSQPLLRPQHRARHRGLDFSKHFY